MDLEEFEASIKGLEKNAPPDMPPEAKLALLREYAEQSIDFKRGDIVVRNKFGEQRYRQPVKGEYGVVLDVFDRPQYSSEQSSVHGVIGVIHDTGKEKRVIAFEVDLRCYKKGDPHEK